MRYIQNAIIVTAMTLTSLSAQAELIKGDWKIDGDQQVVTDTQSKLDWLKLSNTAGMSVASVKNQLGGGSFDGFRLPSYSEYLELVVNIYPGISINNSSTTLTTQEASKWYDLMGSTGLSYASQSWVMNASHDMRLSGVHNQTLYVNYSNNFYNPYYYNGHYTAGVFLVRESDYIEDVVEIVEKTSSSVPAPASLGLLALAITGFGFRRKN